MTDAFDGIEGPAIDGTSLPRYAALTRQMTEAGIAGPQAIDHWLTSRGIEPGAWRRITAGWMARMARSAAVRRRYDDYLRRDIE